MRAVLALALLALLSFAMPSLATREQTQVVEQANLYAGYTLRTPQVAAAVPTFKLSTTVPTVDTTIDALLLHDTAGDLVHATYEDLNMPSNYELVVDQFTRAHAYALAHSGLTAFPTYRDIGEDRELFLVNTEAGELLQAPYSELQGAPSTPAEALSDADVLWLWPAVQVYCKAQAGGYAGGIPTGGDSTPDGGVRQIEVACIKSDYATLATLQYYWLTIFNTVNVGSWPANRLDLLWTNLVAIAELLRTCTWLQPTWRSDLEQVFLDGFVAFSEVSDVTLVQNHGSNSIQLNLEDHSTSREGPTDLRQIIIHALFEMLGYNPPAQTRSDAWAPNNWACSTTGVGSPQPEYFSTAPLQAECCVTGGFYNGRADATTDIAPFTPGPGSGSTGGTGSSTGGPGPGPGGSGKSCAVTLPTGANPGTCGTTLNDGGSCTLEAATDYELDSGSATLTCSDGVLSPLPVYVPIGSNAKPDGATDTAPTIFVMLFLGAHIMAALRI